MSSLWLQGRFSKIQECLSYKQSNDLHYRVNWLLFLTVFSILLMAFTPKVVSQTYSDVAAAKGINIQNVKGEWGGGVNFFDYDRDGEDDLTYADSLKFYTNNNGSFVEKNFVKVSGNVNQVLWFDFDNDGDNDLFITYGNRSNVMYENTGGLNFRKMTNSEIDLSYNNSSFGVSACDYNKDGYLDIYVANAKKTFGQNPDPKEFNKLYRNNGNGTFTEVGLKVGVADGSKYSFQGIWIDYNDDGWQDLYVINDLDSANSLYRNNQNGTFTEVTGRTNTGFSGHHPMSATAGDFDNNGGLDIFMSNSFANPSGLLRDALLLKDDGKGNFSEKASAFGINVQLWSWGATWVDYNNDTYQDLYITTANIASAPSYFYRKNQFYENMGGDTFRKRQKVFGVNSKTHSFSVAKGDLNNDGYYDLFVQNNQPKQAQLWQNSGSRNHYIKTTLAGTVSNRMAIGSWIHVYVDTFSYHKYTKCGENYLSQNSQHKIFGLDTATKVDSVIVEYLSGIKDRYYNLSVDTHYYFQEGETRSIALDSLKLLCKQGDSARLKVSGPYQSIIWNNKDTGQAIMVSEPGKYWAKGLTKSGAWVYSDTAHVKQYPEVKTETTDVSCQGKQDGNIKLTLDSIARRFNPEFTWSDTNKSTHRRNSLSAGHYPYKYSDSTGCSVRDTIQVTEPSPLNLQTRVNFQPNKTYSSASLNAVINGGTPPYIETLDGDTISTPVKNLPVDTYRYTVIDSQGCRSSKQVIIARDSVPSVEAKVRPATCSDASDGRITLQISGFPNRQYQISWQGGYRGHKVTDLQAGKYVYRYSDDEGAQYTDTVRVPSPDSLSIKTDITPQTLDRLGRIHIKVSGGTAPYRIKIDGRKVDSVLKGVQAGRYPIKVTDSQGCVKQAMVQVPDQRSPEIRVEKGSVSCHGGSDGYLWLQIDSLFHRTRNFSIRWQDGVRGMKREDLSAGSYTYRYRDQEGMVVRDTVKVPEPSPLRYRKEATTVSGSGGCAVNIRVKGGTPPYNIRWDSGYRTNSFRSLAAGHHALSVTDRHGCKLDTSVSISRLKAPEVAVDQTPASCAASGDGEVSLSFVGSRDSSLAVIWSDGNEGKHRDSLGAGAHGFAVVTSAGCRYRDTVEVSAPLPLDVQYQVSQDGATRGATLNLVINGGTAPYRVYVDGVQEARPIDSLSPGEHTLEVKDAHNCREALTIAVPEAGPTGLPGGKDGDKLYASPVPLAVGEPLMLHATGQWGKDQRVSVVSSRGTEVYTGTLRGDSAPQRISTAGWSPGIYIIQVQGQHLRKTLKVAVYE
jgi:hypothetical protein